MSSSRRSSKSSRYHQQYLTFLRKWKNYIRSSAYEECEQLCVEHINEVAASISRRVRASGALTGDFVELKQFRSKVRNLYAVLLHDYLKRHEDALEQYEYCIADDPSNASAHYNWAILYKNHFRDYRKAEVHYKKAIELKPRHAAYHNNYGLLLEQQLLDFSGALARFKKALELDPSNGRAHTNMANLLKKHFRDFEGAAFHYRKAIEMDTDNPIRHFNFALFLKHSLRDYDSAALEYEKALDLDPSYDQALAEYKSFLLRESPLPTSRRKKAAKPSATGLSEADARRMHAARCIRQCVVSLWTERVDEARDFLNMALRCNAKNRFATFVQEPASVEADLHDADASAMADQLQAQSRRMSQVRRRLRRFDARIGAVVAAEHSLGAEATAAFARLRQDIVQLATDGVDDADGGRHSDDSDSDSGDLVSAPPRSKAGDSFSAMRSFSRGGGKRHSLRSAASSVGGLPQRVDFQKKDVVSSLAIVRSLLAADFGEDEKERMQTLVSTLERTLKCLELVSEAGVGQMTGSGGGGALGIGSLALLSSAATRRGGSALMDDTASAVSQATIAMDQRRQFLKDASVNPEVRAADRAVAKEFAKTYFRKDEAAHTYEAAQDGDHLSDDGSETSCISTMTTSAAASKAEVCLSKVDSLLAHSGISRKLQGVNDWDFDVFGLVAIAGHFGMGLLFLTVARNRDLVSRLCLNEALVANFFYYVSKQYRSNPYHNREHGCDVLVNVNYFMQARVFDNVSDLDLFSGLLASACHDVGHPGVNNAFEVGCESEVAVTYNDMSVLENMHVAMAWRTLQRMGCNLLEGLTPAQRKHVRKAMIDAIVATDMDSHSAQMDKLTALIDDIRMRSGVDLSLWSKGEEDSEEEHDSDEDSSMDEARASGLAEDGCVFHDKKKLASILIPLSVHTADLSNPCKPKLIYCRWAERVMTEFWNQGDKERERGLAVTPLFDRRVTDKPTCQVGFLNYVIKPWFDLWTQIFAGPKQGPLLQKHILQNIEYMQGELQKMKAQKAKEKQKREEEDASKAKPKRSLGDLDEAKDTDALKSEAAAEKKKAKKKKKSSASESSSTVPAHLQKRGREKKAMSIVDLSFEEIAQQQIQKQIDKMVAWRKRQEALGGDFEIDATHDLSSLRQPVAGLTVHGSPERHPATGPLVDRVSKIPESSAVI